MSHHVDSKFVSVSALALACFAVGFSVTAAAYGARRSAEMAPREGAELREDARDVRDLRNARDAAPRGCHLAR
jgi:hypothetical protein